MVAKANNASNKLMEWWKHLIFPVKKIWLSLSSRLKSRKKKSGGGGGCGGGILKLRDDVQTCEYEDVQVMWEMLRRSESEVNHDLLEPQNNRRPFWNVLIWSSSSSSSSSNNNHTTKDDMT